ncbi:MAG: VWA domain-containing protein, partial [Candidatus Pacebacteria bacterium]|nr:VWA domain-containing protein [Candidatus Paceibacterota bacterium]
MNFLNVNTASATLFAVVALVVWITIGYGRRRRARVLDRMCGPTMAERLTSTVHAGKRRWRLGIFLMAVGLLFVAAARPWWGKRLVPAPQRSRDIIIALDCSRSMLATDVAPSRLVHAKWVIRRLIERFPGDRFGLVAFSGDAFLECPLTQDRSTLFQFLDDIDSDTIGLGGTNLERALTVAQEAFGGAEGGNQAVILVTDGDELQGNAERSIKTYREQETAIHFIGIGDPAQGAVVKTENNEFLRDKKGDLVTSRLDELRLRTLASRADGAYVRSTAVHPRLEPITETLDKLVPERKDAMANMRPVERFQLPLALAVICLILRFFIGQRKTVSSGALIALVAAVCVFGGGATAGDS